ncbi:FHA domain-containing protein [Salinibacterium sp. ZJ454]|uniref:FHA domain-containing protein n=1 Tax=Salinibacterium sp. ZJ454 TaxID=2708339 RepID=UPI0014204A8C|nr:FHA domain-containing protein [Salinibacterium sp. ZJ454]
MSDQPAKRPMIAPPPGLIPQHPDLESGTHKVARRQVSTERAAEIPAFFPGPVGIVAAPETGEIVATTPARWTIVLPDGRRIPILGGAAVIGRNPATPAQWPDATLIPVIDPEKSVSKTHAAFELDGEALWLHDLNSTNGVVLNGTDCDVVAHAGHREAVPDGTTVLLGNYAVRLQRQ